MGSLWIGRQACFYKPYKSPVFSDLNFYLLGSCVSNSKHFIVGLGRQALLLLPDKGTQCSFVLRRKATLKLVFTFPPQQCFTVLWKQFMLWFFTKSFQGDCDLIFHIFSTLSIKNYTCATLLCIDSLTQLNGFQCFTAGLPLTGIW